MNSTRRGSRVERPSRADYTERSAAVHRLEELKDPEGISPLLHTLRHDPEPAVRQVAAHVLGGLAGIAFKARHDEIITALATAVGGEGED